MTKDLKNGTDFYQNYDLVVKLMARALRNQTLGGLGIKTGRKAGIEPMEQHDDSQSLWWLASFLIWLWKQAGVKARKQEV